MNPFEIDQFARNLAEEIHEITGHLTDHEARHLAMLAFLTKDEGELLEIGSFMGTPSVRQKTQNAQLAEKLQAWVNACPETTPHSSVWKIWLKIKRAQVPHFAMSTADLQTLLNEGITSEIKESI